MADICGDCKKPMLDDGTGCRCIVVAVSCECGESASDELLTKDDALVEWVFTHTTQGHTVDIKTALPN